MAKLQPNRRVFLGTALAGVALAQRAFAQNLTTTVLGDGVHLIAGAGANLVARIGSDSVVLVDGGLAEHAGDVTKSIAEFSGKKPIRTLFNTHWHPESTGLNLALRNGGATVIAHENTRLWLTTDITRPWESRTFSPLPKAALPNKTFYEKDSLTVDGEKIEYGYLLQAHTDGDLYVYFPKSNVLAIGDVTSANAWPLIDWWTGGWIFGIVSGLETLLKVANDQTKIVPGQGPVMTKAELEAHHKMYTAIAQKLRTMMFGGRSVDDAIAAQPTKEYDVKMGDPKQFVRLAFQSMWGHFTPDA